ncbi:MAG: carbonic anhydrase [Ignavibacteriae bacterium]|nr:MAG: carbonic anhydrase [Ignavibacteriota bacterium]
MTKQIQSQITPSLAAEYLKEGNKRFTEGKTLSKDFLNQVKETSTGQFPFATILSCMDSRTPSEIIFDQGLGDIFNIRIAGNIADDDIIGSMEYACKVVGSKLIVVAGHTDCGAIKGAIDDVQLGNLTGLLKKIKPAINEVKTDGERNSDNKTFVDMVTKENVFMAIKLIRDRSTILKEMEDKEEIKIIGAMYNTSTGEVDFFEN